MRSLRFLAMAGLVGALAALAFSKPSPPAAPTAKATIEARSGSKVTGAATFTEKDGGVQVDVEVSGVPQGVHAVHVHEKGDCSAPDATSAGGHFNPTNMPHAGPDAPQHHAGDFGNMTVANDGKGKLSLHSTMLTVAPGPNSVVGRSIIVHERADDLKTQPTGNAGGRIGCGVIR